LGGIEQGKLIASVTYTNGAFIAVGGTMEMEGFSMISVDGNEWIEQETPGGLWFSTATSGDGELVSVSTFGANYAMRGQIDAPEGGEEEEEPQEQENSSGSSSSRSTTRICTGSITTFCRP